MRVAALYEMLFAVLMITAGITGFQHEDRRMSLIGRLGAGLIIFFTAFVMQKGSRRAMYVELFASLFVAGWYGYKFFMMNKEFMPEGFTFVLAAFSILLILLILVQPKQRQRIY